MTSLANILWHFPFLGFADAALTYVLGALLCLTVVGAPIGIGLMEYGKFLFAPYSRAMVDRHELNEKQSTVWRVLSFIVRVLYLPLGIVLSLIALIQVVLLAVTIVGIPVATVIAKSLGTYINPINKKCVPQVVADEIVKRKELAKHFGP